MNASKRVESKKGGDAFGVWDLQVFDGRGGPVGSVQSVGGSLGGMCVSVIELISCGLKKLYLRLN